MNFKSADVRIHAVVGSHMLINVLAAELLERPVSFADKTLAV